MCEVGVRWGGGGGWCPAATPPLPSTHAHPRTQPHARLSPFTSAYRARTRVHPPTKIPTRAVQFGSYGREDNTMVLVSKSGKLTFKMLKRTAKMEVGRTRCAALAPCSARPARPPSLAHSRCARSARRRFHQASFRPRRRAGAIAGTRAGCACLLEPCACAGAGVDPLLRCPVSPPPRRRICSVCFDGWMDGLID